MNDPLGVDAGSLGSLESMGLTNEYKDIPDQSLDAIADRVNPNQVASGVTRGIQQLGSDKVYSDGGNQQIIVEDTNEPRVMMGNHATFGEGFFVSKDGTNVKTNTNPANLIFNSSQNVFKVVVSSTASMTGSSNISSGTTQTLTIAHNLGIIPAVIIYSNAPSGSLSGFQGGAGIMNLPIHYMLPSATTGKPWFWIQSRIDATNLYLDLVCVGGTANDLSSMTWSFKYYLLQETAT